MQPYQQWEALPTGMFAPQLQSASLLLVVLVLFFCHNFQMNHWVSQLLETLVPALHLTQSLFHGPYTLATGGSYQVTWLRQGSVLLIRCQILLLPHKSCHDLSCGHCQQKIWPAASPHVSQARLGTAPMPGMLAHPTFLALLISMQCDIWGDGCLYNLIPPPSTCTCNREKVVECATILLNIMEAASLPKLKCGHNVVPLIIQNMEVILQCEQCLSILGLLRWPWKNSKWLIRYCSICTSDFSASWKHTS